MLIERSHTPIMDVSGRVMLIRSIVTFSVWDTNDEEYVERQRSNFMPLAPGYMREHLEVSRDMEKRLLTFMYDDKLVTCDLSPPNGDTDTPLIVEK